MINAYRILIRKRSGKDHLRGRGVWPIWKYVIKMDFKEIGYVDWIHLAQDRIR
jgi:hypothetical protein